METLRLVEVIALIVAAVAVAAAAVRVFLLAGRVGHVLEEEVRPALGEVRETARRAQETLGKADATLVPFAQTARRVEKWTAALAAETLLAGALSPAMAKVGGWLGRLGRGLGRVVGRG